jgi:hypothetical protein
VNDTGNRDTISSVFWGSSAIPKERFFGTEFYIYIGRTVLSEEGCFTTKAEKYP